MLFPTLEFFGFFVVVLLLAHALRFHVEARKLMLIAASYVFYAGWNWHFCFLLAGSSLWSYGAGRLLGAVAGARARAWILRAAIGGHLLLLGTFKYFDFFVGSANEFLHSVGFGYELPFVEIILPVGISFFTFHGISYVMDVARGDVPVCRRLPDMLLYMSFFPQLVAGPIVRASFFLPQIGQDTVEPIAIGPPILLILGGLFKKVVIANYVATNLVDPVFFDPDSFPFADLLFAVYGYAVQIYCDFSAYSDIAIGLAGLLGYYFPPNFNQPYRAQSLREFWRRWHISLSSWLRDYLYKPIGGSRGSRWFTARNLMITMVLGGLWHGAAWKFVAWGALHGIALTVEHFVAPNGWARSRLGKVLAIIVVFHVVCLGWIFFRADSFADAVYYLGDLAKFGGGISQLSPLTLLLVALGMGLNFVPLRWVIRTFHGMMTWPEWLVGSLAGVGIVVVNSLGPDGVAPFIYFQF